MASQRITARILRSLGTGFLVSALLTPGEAAADQFLSITIASEHFGLDGDYNEFNPGLGYWRYAEESALAYGGGCFRNSEENASCYGGVGLSTDESGVAHIIGYAGLVSGYDKIEDCTASICPLLGGAVRTRLGPGLVSVDLLPGRDGDDTGAILALQYLVEID